ncbi:hypothetical protein [Mycolicibacterium moriokaense]|uniref:hypothetical protein n=1 Tax=Mycolicibacterium moriokaense TaxID=39691 RepID=UPI0011B63324|nr:hypothetical protein [Mycolicibacterium moriokaense]
MLFARSWMNRHVLWQTASEVGPAGACGHTPDGSDDEEQSVGPENDPPQGSGPSGEDPGSPGGNASPAEEPVDQPGKPSSGGSMRFQDPSTARPARRP